MGKGRGPSENCAMFSVITLNCICGLLGALLFSLGMWMRLERDVKEWIHELGITQYWTGLYILMAAGAIIMLISFCGCCGAFMGNTCLLGTNLSITSLAFVLVMTGAVVLLANVITPTINYERLNREFEIIVEHKDARTDRFLIFLWYNSTVMIILALILELAGAIYILINGTESSQLTPHLQNKFNSLMVDSNYNPEANRILQIVQEKVGCCGANNYRDYQLHNLPISDFCRDYVSGNIYQEGCVQQLSIFLEKRTGWLAGIALLVGLLQIMLVCVSFCYWRNMRDEEENGGPKYYTEVPRRDY